VAVEQVEIDDRTTTTTLNPGELKVCAIEHGAAADPDIRFFPVNVQIPKVTEPERLEKGKYKLNRGDGKEPFRQWGRGQRRNDRWMRFPSLHSQHPCRCRHCQTDDLNHED